MKLDHDRLLMSLAKTEAEDNAEHTLSNSKVDQMLLLPEQDQLPAKVANVSRDELRKFVQCKRVGNYLLGKTVGEGSFAKVKEALHILTGEKVAIKIIDKNRARKDKYVSKNMRREARLLQMVRHPHIVQLLEIVETSQCYYLVFEFADGGELMDYICRRKKLEEEEVRKFIRQIISAVEYLHRLGIIHRDLKVENLLLDVKKNIKIIDFGLSNTIYSPDPKNENHCSTQCGSPAYAAPELLVRKDYGPQIDVWSIGVNLYAMLTGRLPYTVEPFNISALYNKMLKKEMNVIPEYLSEGCKDFIHQLLNPNPKERITLQEAAKHRWITNSQRDPLLLTTCPNYLSEEDLEDNILDHVENQLKLNSDDVIRDVIQNRATKNSCVYHLLLRRLERYRRDYGDVITPPAKSKMEEERRVSQQYEQTLTTFKVSSQQNGIIQDQRAPAKPQIMENPFKTIKVTLIRQKNATNNAGISKPVTTDMSSSSTASHTPSRSESAHKHKLCPVKRVALVKVSPARRSFRPTLSSSRHSIRSPMTHRRKNYFEGLQHRRKSPKVRRRHAELDDSQSSVGSNSTKRNDVHIKKSPQEATHRRSENKPSHKSHRDRNFKNVESKVTTEKCVTECANEKPRGQLTPLPTTEVDGKTLETVTHFYTDKGVALKRNSTGTNGKVDSDIDTENERKSVQHHVFHSNGEVSMEDTMDTHESQRNNGDGNGKSTVETSGKHKEPDIRVVNAKISSIPVRSLERLQPISPRINSSCTPTSQAKDPSETEPSPSRVFDEKSVTSKRSFNGYFSSSKIPIPAAKGPPGHQSPASPACLAPKSPSPSTAKDHPSRTAETKDELPTSGDKYTKCFSVIVVNRPSTMKELGAIKNSGAEDQSANAKKNESGVNSGTAITITDEENGRQMKANENVRADLPRIRKAITRSKSQEPPRLSAGEKQSESSPKDNKGNGQDLISKKLVKCNETSKNKNVDRKLPKMKESSGQHQSAKAKEVRKTHSWGGDERRKISNYRKTTDTQQTKVTVRRDSRTPPTSHKVHSFKNGS